MFVQKQPALNQPVVKFDEVEDVFIDNCFQITPVKRFYDSRATTVMEGNNCWKNVETNL